MGSEEVIETKLDILIKDFQRFRQNQEQVNKDLSEHSTEESNVQASIANTQIWQNLIGGALFCAICWFYIVEYIPLKEQVTKNSVKVKMHIGEE